MPATTATARSLLAEWLRQRHGRHGCAGTGAASRSKSRSITTHRNVFGVFFWFLMPLGPAGAVMYRVAEYLARAWNEPDHMRNEAFGQFADPRLLLDRLDAGAPDRGRVCRGRQFRGRHLCLAQFCATAGRTRRRGIILSAGGGAMGVRLGTPHENATSLLPTGRGDGRRRATSRPRCCPARSRRYARCKARSGLVWRALLLWMLLLLLLSGAVWLG